MDLALCNEFCEVSKEEMLDIDGGFIIAVVAIGSATYTITSGMAAGAIATAWGLGTVGYEIYNAFT